MLLSLLSSPSTGLEALLPRTPRSPSFSVAGRLSYSAAPSPLPSTNSPLLESDIGLQSPSSFSCLSSARVTYSDLVSSSQHLDWSSSPGFGAGPVQRQGQSSSNSRSSDARRRIAARINASQGRFASISQVLASPPPVKKGTDGVEICTIDIFGQGAGIGLGLGLTSPLTLVDVPRSTDEYTLIPITEVAPGSISRSNHPDASSSSQPVTLATSSPNLIHISAPSPTAEFPPAPSRADPTQTTKYAGLGHGLPSHMRGAGARRLPSIPEEVAETKPSAPVSKVSQHSRLGLGVPSVLRHAVQKHTSSPSSPAPAPAPVSSPRAQMPFKRLQSTMHELFSTRKFAKRTLFPIPEARSREASAEGHAAEKDPKGRTASWVQQQQQQQRRRSSRLGPSPSPRPQMSQVMLLAAQSILEEERKFRKKEGLDKVASPMSPTMRMASQMVQAQEEQRKLRKLEQKQAEKKFKFLF